MTSFSQQEYGPASPRATSPRATKAQTGQACRPVGRPRRRSDSPRRGRAERARAFPSISANWLGSSAAILSSAMHWFANSAASDDAFMSFLIVPMGASLYSSASRASLRRAQSSFASSEARFRCSTVRRSSAFFSRSWSSSWRVAWRSSWRQWISLSCLRLEVAWRSFSLRWEGGVLAARSGRGRDAGPRRELAHDASSAGKPADGECGARWIRRSGVPCFHPPLPLHIKWHVGRS